LCLRAFAAKKQMKNILNRLINQMLTAAEAKEVLVNISNGSYNPSQISAFFDRLHDAQHQH
jgi:anthranilate phosphoribosyltransferase